MCGGCPSVPRCLRTLSDTFGHNDSPSLCTLQLILHGVAHHLAVLLVKGVGATHAGVLLDHELLEVNLGDQLDVRRPGEDIAWRRENSYCKIENTDEGMAKKSRRPIF